MDDIDFPRVTQLSVHRVPQVGKSLPEIARCLAGLVKGSRNPEFQTECLAMLNLHSSEMDQLQDEIHIRLGDIASKMSDEVDKPSRSHPKNHRTERQGSPTVVEEYVDGPDYDDLDEDAEGGGDQYMDEEDDFRNLPVQRGPIWDYL